MDKGTMILANKTGSNHQNSRFVSEGAEATPSLPNQFKSSQTPKIAPGIRPQSVELAPSGPSLEKTI
jgi:hypothetical protein